MKEYSASYVVYIEDSLAKSVLERHIVIHKMDKSKVIFKTGTITVTLYIKPKKDPRSKLHIQSGDQARNLEFILETLSLYYKEVSLACESLVNNRELKDLGRSMCVKCGKYFTNKRGLKAHMLRMYTSLKKKKVGSGLDEQTPITLEESVDPKQNLYHNNPVSMAVSMSIVNAPNIVMEVQAPPIKKKKNDNTEESGDYMKQSLIQDIINDMLENCPGGKNLDQLQESNYQCGDVAKFSQQKKTPWST